MSRENPNSATAAISVPMPAMYRGSMRLTRFEESPAPKTMPNENGRNAKPARSGL